MALRIVTANRLGDGVVVYLAAAGRWTERLIEAEAVDSDAAEAGLIAAAEKAVAARLVVGSYAMAVGRDGADLRPLSQRERIRAQGPTVRLDFCRPPTGDVSQGARAMYAYDDADRTLVAERVGQFRGQVKRRLKGELSEDEFRPLRLMNGLYMQLHAYMLRVAIPYGTLAAAQLRRLASIARRYDKGYGHFTTRQNIQFNWPKLEAVPDILAELAEVEMHAIQTSGNSIRNVTADPYAGVAADEIEDSRVTAEVIRQWSTLHPEFSFLPRKFKIAVTGSPRDRAAVKVHDIGLRMLRDAEGQVGYEVIVGGGQGRTPFVGPVIRDFLPKRHLLSYLEAILRVYNREGRRDNLFKARIKILVSSLGAAKFAEKVEAEWREIEKGSSTFRPSTGPTSRRRHTRRFPPTTRRSRPPGSPIPRSAPGFAPTSRPTSSPAMPSSTSRSSRWAEFRATPPPRTWKPSPPSPIASASARFASPTPRTWCCPMSAWPTSTPSGGGSTRPGSPPPTSA